MSELLGELRDQREIEALLARYASALDARDWERLATSWRPRLDEQIAVLTRMRDQLDGCIGCGCLSLTSCGLWNPDDAAAELGTGPRYLLSDERPVTSGENKP